ncbi:3'(2'),5'-bisphosphate nucleotidase CysQ [Aquibium sp. A9E412]|uniref:3'(2'),5'-bisphosphate nucleotidase CysQ n=1 Tax=Aquibium sp. A9E412 TaxID=2976767 RepID=UPI0025AEFEAE|nr:3'(2'),5'-bisphosphate nucleotidase CysQ [Aquibium sp. A9E412]MDN2566081.1 3'(2'),5'-bisphosphate nucleotidase CysQ [Aquibium sp. A9E412]
MLSGEGAAARPAQPADADLVAGLEELALEAGRAIMACYARGVSVSEKADASPVTEADTTAEAIILRGLARLCPQVPVVAEESVAAGRVPPALDGAFLLVDPLDGTREFVNRRDDFTVNIALVRGGVPELGVVYAPARSALFAARPDRAEAATVEDGARVVARGAIAVRGAPEPPVIVASRSHRTAETDAFIARFPGAELMAVGSSLKFCMLASGRADLYPRFGRTMEWDTAAGDAVLRAAGGRTLTLDGRPLAYGKRDQPHDSDFANPWFVAEAGCHAVAR